MTHQVLEEYNSLPTAPTTNGTNRVPQKLLKLLHKYLLMVTWVFQKLFNSKI